MRGAGLLATRLLLAVIASASVVPLLAWVYGLGSFAAWFRWFALPAIAVVAAAGTWTSRTREAEPGRASTTSATSATSAAIAAGVLGGAIGTLGYDLFRVPFTIAGFRVLAPIDSYGVLLLDAATSSPLTGLAGWAYHFTNGIGFGITYALVARGRSWWWALLWAMVLETATIVTPFVDAYALRGNYEAIAIAYAAHVAYGVPLGLVVRAAGRWRSAADAPLRPLAVIGVIAFGLLVWHRPWSTPPGLDEARRLSPQPAAVIRRWRFTPEWLRARPGACVSVRNDDGRAVRIVGPGKDEVVAAPRETVEVCTHEKGVFRVRVDDRPFSGGFVIADAEARCRPTASRPCPG